LVTELDLEFEAVCDGFDLESDVVIGVAVLSRAVDYSAKEPLLSENTFIVVWGAEYAPWNSITVLRNVYP